MKKAIFTVLGIFLLLTACRGTTETSVNPIQEAVDPIGTYLDQIEVISQEWDDAISLADSTGRGNLPDRIAELQRIRRRAQFLDVPSEAESPHNNLVKAMDYAIDGFLAFMVEDEYSSYFVQYQSYLNKWESGLAELEE